MPAKPGFMLPLSDASAGLSQVGGKGASPARLAAAGLPLPPGFQITTAAYRRFVAEHGRQERILAAEAAASADQPATLEQASRRIGELYAQGAIPEDMTEEIRLSIPADLAPGCYRLLAGAYDSETVISLRGAGGQEWFELALVRVGSAPCPGP